MYLYVLCFNDMMVVETVCLSQRFLLFDCVCSIYLYHYDHHETMPWFKWLGCQHVCRGPGWIPGQSRWDLWKTEWVLGQVFFKCFRFSSVSIIPPVLYTHSWIYHQCYIIFATAALWNNTLKSHYHHDDHQYFVIWAGVNFTELSPIMLVTYDKCVVLRAM